MTLDELMKDKDFREWFDSRPEKVQKVILDTPPIHHYVNANDGDDAKYRFLLHSYDEEESGEITITAEKHYAEDFPLPGYSVFGLKPSELKKASIIPLI